MASPSPSPDPWLPVPLDEAAEGRVLRHLVQTTEQPLLAVDAQGRCTFANPAGLAVLGFDEAELLGADLCELIHPVGADGSPCDTAGCDVTAALRLRHGVAFDTVLHRRGVEPFPAVGRGEPLMADGVLVGSMITFEDVTVRRREEEAARRGQALQRIAGQLGRIGGWAIELPSMAITWSEELYQILDHRDGDPTAYAGAIAQYVEPDRPRIDGAIEACIASGTPFDLEADMDTFAGRRIRVRVVGQPERDADGRITRIVGALQDITEHQRAVAAAEEAAIRLAEALGSMGDAFLTLDEGWRITYLNDRAEELLEQPRAELLGRDIRAAFPQVVGSTAEELAERARSTGDTAAGEQRSEVTGAWYALRIHPSPRGLAVQITDVTDRKRLEAQARHRQRLESVGALAGGVAHDLNNVLTPIIMSAGLLESTDLDDLQRQAVGIIASSARRGADVVRQIVAVAGKDEGHPRAVDPREVVAEVAKIAEDTFLKAIRVVLEQPDAPWPALADPTQLHQVLLNLCVNARDAMPAGGTLSLGIANVVVEEPEDDLGGRAAPGRYVALSVEDDGLGMSPEVLEQAFDPFFTTKGSAGGTGLGLATSAAIIRDHGGFIRVRSTPRKGTRFDVHVPAADIAAAAADSGSPPPRGTGQRVLLVDDEADIRAATATALQRHGYRVGEAVEGAAALKALDQAVADGDPYDLVLTDLVMPGVGGAALIDLLRVHHPGVRVLAASGLHDQLGSDGGRTLGVAAVLRKPYDPREVLRTLADVVGGGLRRTS